MKHEACVETKVTSAAPMVRGHDLRVSQAKGIAIASYADHRGDLTPIFHSLGHHFAGVNFNVRQIMCSRSNAGVVRGMHSQARTPQAKLVTCVQGRIFDVVYDARPGSPTYGQHDIVLLEGPEHSVYVPPGCLHGFYVLEDAVVLYACDQLYDPASDGGVRWDSLGIAWPDKEPIVSDKDIRLGTLGEWRVRCQTWAQTQKV